MEKKHSKLIILDFDHTILNTTAYVGKLQQEMEKVGISKDEFWSQRQALKDCCHLVDIDAFVGSLSLEDKKLLHNVVHDTIRDHIQEFVFSDVNTFIARHAQEFDLMILTQGSNELQKEKIQHSGLSTLRHKVVAEMKTEAVGVEMDAYEKVVFIDDKAQNVDDVKKTYPEVETYFLQRPEDKPYSSIGSQCDCADHVIADLNFVIA